MSTKEMIYNAVADLTEEDASEEITTQRVDVVEHRKSFSQRDVNHFRCDMTATRKETKDRTKTFLEACHRKLNDDYNPSQYRRRAPITRIKY